MRIKTVMNHNQENDQKNRPHDLDFLNQSFELQKKTISLHNNFYI